MFYQMQWSFTVILYFADFPWYFTVISSVPAVNPLGVVHELITVLISAAYEGYTVDLPLTINDPLDHITVNPPTKITYEHGDNISFTGGSITTYTKSLNL